MLLNLSLRSINADCLHQNVPVQSLVFEVETLSFEFAKHVSDDQHPSSVANTNEPLVGVT